MYAWATAVSDATPDTILESKSVKNEFAMAKRMKLVVENTMDMRSIGFLPTLSDTSPNIGAKKNATKEEEAKRSPKAVEPTLK
jgi:hypothetical protein